MPSAVRKMNPPTLPDAGAVGYSQVAVTDAPRLAFVSGQVAQTADGAPIPEDLAGQVPVVMANVGHALDALGATADDVVSVRAYVVDLDPAKSEGSRSHRSPPCSADRPPP